uniref:Pseudouridine-5'-phosphate glycosidase n=1 Tax=Culex pipiens TaxID=7175 RepID=A0A8D8DXX4_CULPI
MLRLTKSLPSLVSSNAFVRRTYADLSKLSPLVDIDPRVHEALRGSSGSVVALESTIITHGMPYPHNLETALEVEQIVRQKGAIPATIAIVDGRIKVGTTADQLARLAQSDTIKTSRRDLAYVLGKGLSGGTTVAGTLLVADMVGIRVFATGGIGGVHRGGEDSLDVSADLVELGRTPVAVVSSGVKSILDIPRTLEYLETQGVCVASYGSPERDFPAFYTRRSGSKAVYNFDSAAEAANAISVNGALGLRSGFLIGVPIPAEHALDQALMDGAIAEALAEATRQNIGGKEVTPFILAAVSKITAGKSLQSNMALIKNNASVAAEIAVELSRIESGQVKSVSERESASSGICSQRVPVVIGGSIVDTCISVLDDDLKLDGATYHANVNIAGGGVGRNIAEGIWKIYGDVRLVSAVGTDQNGDLIKRLLPDHCRTPVLTTGDHPTANCSILLDNRGDCKLCVGDMSVHGAISVDWINSHRDLIRAAPLVVLDANVSPATMEAIFELCVQHEKPVFFEPTDMRFAAKPFNASTLAAKAIRFISPNLYELREIARNRGYEGSIATTQVEDIELTDLLREVRLLGGFVNRHVDNVIVTLGAYGVVVIRRTSEQVPFFSADTGHYKSTDSGAGTQCRFYRGRALDRIVNVSGAGDSFTSGFVAAMLDGQLESVCVNVGFEAACCALGSKGAVAERYFDRGHSCWKPANGATFITVNE